MYHNSDAITKNIYKLDKQKFKWKTKAISKPKDIKLTGKKIFVTYITYK